MDVHLLSTANISSKMLDDSPPSSPLSSVPSDLFTPTGSRAVSPSPIKDSPPVPRDSSRTTRTRAGARKISVATPKVTPHRPEDVSTHRTSARPSRKRTIPSRDKEGNDSKRQKVSEDSTLQVDTRPQSDGNRKEQTPKNRTPKGRTLRGSNSKDRTLKDEQSEDGVLQDKQSDGTAPQDDIDSKKMSKKETSKEETSKEEMNKEDANRQESDEEHSGKNKITEGETGREEVSKDEFIKQNVGKEDASEEVNNVEIGQEEGEHQEFRKEEVSDKEISVEEVNNEENEISKEGTNKEEVNCKEVSNEGAREHEASREDQPKEKTPEQEVTFQEKSPGRSTRPRRTAPRDKTDLDIDMINAPLKFTPPSTKRRQPMRGNWTVSHLMANPNSKLATINLADLLSKERAWTELDRSQQELLIAMLPGKRTLEQKEDEPLPNVLRDCLKSNTSFQADVRFFQEDLAVGRYDPKWISDAEKAAQKRAQGTFDSWKEKNQEAFWGQKQKINWSALAGDSSVHDLQTLIKAGLFKVGDVWFLRRGLGHGANGVVVEKEAIITHIDDSNHTLSFSFPPHQNRFSTPTATDKTVTDIQGPIMISDAILKEDGRIVGVRGPNSWKEFRCIRKNQDMGSLWDIRELYHHRLNQ